MTRERMVFLNKDLRDLQQFLSMEAADAYLDAKRRGEEPYNVDYYMDDNLYEAVDVVITLLNKRLEKKEGNS